MKIDLDNYSFVLLMDSSEPYVCYGAVMLNTKRHTIGEFQKAIIDASEKHEKDIEDNGCDWEYIKEELTNFDYFEIDYDFDNDYVVF